MADEPIKMCCGGWPVTTWSNAKGFKHLLDESRELGLKLEVECRRAHYGCRMTYRLDGRAVACHSKSGIEGHGFTHQEVGEVATEILDEIEAGLHARAARLGLIDG